MGIHPKLTELLEKEALFCYYRRIYKLENFTAVVETEEKTPRFMQHNMASMHPICFPCLSVVQQGMVKNQHTLFEQGRILT